MTINLYAGVIKQEIISVNKASNIAKIKIDKIDVGVSGFLVHELSSEHTSILKNLEVIDFDTQTNIATLRMTNFDLFKQNSLPSGKWEPKVGDIAVLAFGYNRALLISPSEEIYYRITRATKNVQWIHPDLFATTLSFNGHPTPLKEDFVKMSNSTSAGIVFFYLNKKVFTVDAKSLVILSISDAPLEFKEPVLPFYTRVEEIDANWFGEGSDELEHYEPYYYGLLIKNNPNNQEIKSLYNQYVKENKKDD